MKWSPPPPGSEERKEMPNSAFLSPGTKTYPYKVLIDGQWVISEPGLRSAISVANFRGQKEISKKASNILESLLSKEASHSVDDVLNHFGIPGMKWGVRKAQEMSERRKTKKDTKWATKKGSKIAEKLKKQSSREAEQYARSITGAPRKKSGTLSMKYVNAYNQKLAGLMNQKVGDISAPSGKVLQFVAKRGEVGVHTALADRGYDMGQVEKGIYSSGRVAYRKNIIEKT